MVPGHPSLRLVARQLIGVVVHVAGVAQVRALEVALQLQDDTVRALEGAIQRSALTPVSAAAPLAPPPSPPHTLEPVAAPVSSPTPSQVPLGTGVRWPTELLVRIPCGTNTACPTQLHPPVLSAS